jgi:RNase P protein component
METERTGYNVKDITGQTFYKLTAIKPVGRSEKQCVIWLFKCSCGNMIERPGTDVKCGKIKSCGCLKHFSPAKGRKMDFIEKNYRVLYIREICEETGRSMSTVYDYIRTLKKQNGDKFSRFFTPKEDEFIIENYSKMDFVKLCQRLKRSRASVKNRINILRKQCIQNEQFDKLIDNLHRFDKFDDRYIINGLKTHGINRLGLVVNKNNVAARHRLRKLINHNFNLIDPQISFIISSIKRGVDCKTIALMLEVNPIIVATVAEKIKKGLIDIGKYKNIKPLALSGTESGKMRAMRN